MDIWLFVFGLLTFALMWNSHRPVYGLMLLMFPCFILGWVTAELALHWVVLEAVVAAWLISKGALVGFYGVWGAIFCVATWIGLLMHFFQSKAAIKVAKEALESGLGGDYLSKLRPELRDKVSTKIDWRSIVMPFPIGHPQVECLKSIPYHDADGLRLTLDVMRHRSAPQDAPILFQIHGGGWISGFRRQQAQPLLNVMAAQGWICFNVGYRLCPRATFPEPILDLKRALHWVRQHAHEYGGNPDFIVLSGGSAGGHLASLLALTPNDPFYQPGFEHADTSVDACIPLYGVYDLADRAGSWPNMGLRFLMRWWVIKRSLKTHPELYDRDSPIMRISKDAPPFFVLQGDTDTMVPVAQARRFVEAFRETASDQRCLYAEIPGAQHAFDIFPSVRSMSAVHAAEHFANVVYSEYLTTQEEIK